MAAEAAEEGTEEQRAELAEQIDRLEGLVETPAAYGHEDLRFHDIIMRIATM